VFEPTHVLDALFVAQVCPVGIEELVDHRSQAMRAAARKILTTTRKVGRLPTMGRS